jgi:3-deoxy-D-manno-octulosonate 8-phosphate phosphatase (KDO 8-P phosphatase)
MQEDFFEALKQIHTVVLDVDGVLTDNSLICTEEGGLLRTMNARDGYVLAESAKVGIKLVIITGGNSIGVLQRLEKLGLADIFTNIKDKWPVLRDYAAAREIDLKNVLYMGDDIPDYEVMSKSGLRACPSDAVPEIKSIAHYICSLKGGEGCVREVLELMLKVQEKWFKPGV